jgi:hypothetical protein
LGKKHSGLKQAKRIFFKTQLRLLINNKLPVFNGFNNKFFIKVEEERKKKKLISRGIVDSKFKGSYPKRLANLKNVKVRYFGLSLPAPFTIVNNKVLLTLWDGEPMGIEIKSKRLAKRYKDYFEGIWKKANP